MNILLELISTLAVDANPMQIYVSNNIAYVYSNTTFTIQLFDVSNPKVPVLKSTINFARNIDKIVVSGSYLFILSKVAIPLVDNALYIYDISNVLNPTFTSKAIIQTIVPLEFFCVVGNYVYISEQGLV